MTHHKLVGLPEHKAVGRLRADYEELPLLAGNASSARHHTADIDDGGPGTTGGAARPPSTTSDFRLLGDLQGVIDLDAEVPHR